MGELQFYEVGDKVEKIGGDYVFVGEVRAAFTKLSGAVRYVVEDDRGVLHVYSDENIRFRDYFHHDERCKKLGLGLDKPWRG